LALSYKQGKGNSIRAAKKRIEREVTNVGKEKYVTKKMARVSFNSKVSAHKLMIRFSDVAKSYGKKEVFKDLSFEVGGGEKVWLFGPNGAGKSTLVKLIMGVEEITSGEIKLGHNIKVGYFAQKQDKLDSNKDLLTNFLDSTGCDYEKGFGFLRKYMFTKDDLVRPIKFLSPGQRARYASVLAKELRRVDLPLLGRPIIPASAINFSSNFISRVGVRSPCVALRGVLLTEDLK